MATFSNGGNAAGLSIQTIPLAAIPFFLAISAAAMLTMIAPIYAGALNYDFDPSYQYLFNGVGLIQGYAPRHIDHPGTPLQILSGVISYLAWALDRFTGQTTLEFAPAVVANPEHYIGIISAVLLFVNVAATLYLGIRVKEATQSLSLALVAQAGVALLDTMTPRLGYLSPEALVIFSGLMVMALLSRILLPSPPSQDTVRTGSAIAVGFFLALGVTAKVTFLPLVLLLGVLPTMRARLVGLAALMIFAILFVLPIATQLPTVFQWFFKIANHVGGYGNGEAGFIDFAALPSRLSALFHETGLVFLAGAACILTALICFFTAESAITGSTRRWEIWVSLILLATLAAQMGIVLKHFALHYILPSFIISSTILARTLQLLNLQIRRSPFARVITIGCAAALLIIVVHQTHANFARLSAEKRDRDTQLTLLQQTLDANSDAIVISSYRARTQPYAIQFAMSFVDGDFAKRAMADNPQQFSYNRWNERISRVGGDWFDLSYINELIAQGRKVLMVLPEDVQIPALQAEVLLQIPGRERILLVRHVQQ